MSIDNGVEILKKKVKLYTTESVETGIEDHTPQKSGAKCLRLKDSKDEHDNEEQDVGCQDRQLINALLSLFTDVLPI